MEIKEINKQMSDKNDKNAVFQNTKNVLNCNCHTLTLDILL